MTEESFCRCLQAARLTSVMEPVVASIPLNVSDRVTVASARTRDVPPTPSFNLSQYLEENPDVASARLNPLVHFVRR
jgi:hypothetical protein